MARLRGLRAGLASPPEAEPRGRCLCLPRPPLVAGRSPLRGVCLHPPELIESPRI